jgi:hypothetical protein
VKSSALLVVCLFLLSACEKTGTVISRCSGDADGDGLSDLLLIRLSEPAGKELRFYGGRLERLSARIVLGGKGDQWFNIGSETDRDMALIADTGTGPDGIDYLEQAVGRAAEIFVVTPAVGKLWLTRGAVFDYYEFISGSRMNDEEWQALLKEDGAPARPGWTKSFFVFD